MKYIFHILSITLMLVFGLRMFGMFESFINGAIWLSMFFAGIFLFFVGEYLNELSFMYVSKHNIEKQTSKLSACRNGMLLTIIVLLFIIGVSI